RPTPRRRPAGLPAGKSIRIFRM
ncbi:MAG: hypothetical protein AVDCRST_MAG56-8196, partial [uncultured Cytophagales bacterium]